MNCYRVSRTVNITWCEDYEIIVIAKDELHAERLARVSSDYFKKAQNLKIEEIDINKEQVVTKNNTGA